MEPIGQSQIGQVRMPLITNMEMEVLEQAVRKEIPRFTMLKSVRFWEFGDWIYIFVTNRALWEKLRIFGLQRLIRYVDPETGFVIVEDPGLNPKSMALMVERERQDLLAIEETFKRQLAEGRFTMQVQLPKVATINLVQYQARIKHYSELRNIICKRLHTAAVLTDKLWTRGALRIYQLKIAVDMLSDRYVVRVIENNDLYKVEICKASENLLRQPLECFPLQDDINALLSKIDMIRIMKEFAEVFSSCFAQRFNLSEALLEKQTENVIHLGCWVSEKYGLRVVAQADPFTFQIMVHLHHNYRKEVQQVNMYIPYHPEKFKGDFTTLLDRIRHLEDFDTLDPFFLLHALERYKKAVKRQTIVWDINQNWWHLFSITVLDFPMPITIQVGYDFATERLHVSSILTYGETKEMKQVASVIGQALSQLELQWKETPKPEEVTRCHRIECPAFEASEVEEKVLPEMKKYDIVMANRGNLFDTALYMGKGLILSMKPLGNYKQLKPEAHLLVHSFTEFVKDTELVILRDESLTEAQAVDIDKRLNNMEKQFVYYGFANNSDEIILSARFGTNGSLSTAFFFILLRYLMDKNLVEKELLEYVHGLVLAHTNQARVAFMKERQHSIVKAVGRIKSTSSIQMQQILGEFDWLFEAFAE